MDDAELTSLELDIIQEFKCLNTKSNSVSSELSDIIPQVSFTLPAVQMDDDKHNMSYTTDPGNIQHEPITITSYDILPPIPASKGKHQKHPHLAIRIEGNKKRGIKRWSKRQKRQSYTPSPPDSALIKNDKSNKKGTNMGSFKVSKCIHIDIKKKKKAHHSLQSKYERGEILRIDSNDSIFSGYDSNRYIGINDINRRNNMDENNKYVFSPISLIPMDTKDYDDNMNPFRVSTVENVNNIKCKKIKTSKKKKKKVKKLRKNTRNCKLSKPTLTRMPCLNDIDSVVTSRNNMDNQ